MKIFVTGGTGYIGSHVVVDLLNAGHEVIIIDNLINSKLQVLDRITELTGRTPLFFQTNLVSLTATEKLFKAETPDLVLHFAGLKAVAESIKSPLIYYRNNITGTINLLEAMQEFHVNKIIFSSSATVYGDSASACRVETMPTGQQISNPYGRTKYMIEEILKDVCAANPHFSAVALRYFNPIGNHPSGLLGESPNGVPNNLMPYVMQVATGKLPSLSIYGNDYDTPDGTCRRDFIHVSDLARGHFAAMSALDTPGFKAFNLGTGRPTSVLEIVNAFERISGQPLPHHFAPRRAGDLAEIWADPSLAASELNWHAELTIDDAIKDTLAYLTKEAEL